MFAVTKDSIFKTRHCYHPSPPAVRTSHMHTKSFLKTTPSPLNFQCSPLRTVFLFVFLFQWINYFRTWWNKRILSHYWDILMCFSPPSFRGETWWSAADDTTWSGRAEPDIRFVPNMTALKTTRSLLRK